VDFDVEWELGWRGGTAETDQSAGAYERQGEITRMTRNGSRSPKRIAYNMAGKSSTVTRRCMRMKARWIW
jgi:hypothetical protein